MPEPRAVTVGNRRESNAVRAIAAEQHGVAGRPQLLASGVDGSAIDRALRSGRPHRIHRGVYAAMAPELLIDEQPDDVIADLLDALG